MSLRLCVGRAGKTANNGQERGANEPGHGTLTPFELQDRTRLGQLRDPIAANVDDLTGFFN